MILKQLTFLRLTKEAQFIAYDYVASYYNLKLELRLHLGKDLRGLREMI